MTDKIDYRIFQNHPDILCQSLWQYQDSNQSKATKRHNINSRFKSLQKSYFSANCLVFAKQVHGKQVTLVKKSGIVNHCDGLITARQK